jgi:hypothetical protein
MTDHQKLLCALLSDPDAHFDDRSASAKMTALALMSTLGDLRAELVSAR